MARADTPRFSSALGVLRDAADTETTQYPANTLKEAESRQLPNQYKDQVSSYEWKNWILRKTWTLVFLILDIAIIAVILILEAISRARNGIVEVAEATSTSPTDLSVSNTLSDAGLLWTALPSFLMALYRLIWESIVSAAANRQPYVELRKPKQKAGNAGCSIMLDYQSYSSLYGWVIAFRCGHWILGLCMVLNIILSILLVPITAHLLIAGSIYIGSDILVNPSGTFNTSLFTPKTDAQPAIIAATAHLVYGANPPPWVTTEYAFEPFSIPNVATGNIAIDVNAYAGYLDCQLISPSEYTISTATRISIDLDDRGCRVPTLLLPVSVSNSSARVGSEETIYSKTWSWDQCGDKAHNSRIGLWVGGDSTDASSTGNLNVSIISCIPSFWKTRGALTLSLVRGASTFFFEPLPNATELEPRSFQTLVLDLPDFQYFDPTATFLTDAFGRAVFEYSSMKYPDAPLNGAGLVSSTQEVFTSMFAFLAGTTLLQRTPAATPATATLLVNKTKLFVSTRVAYTLVVMCSLVFGCNILLIWYVEAYPSCLREEPRGLLRMAGILEKSNLSNIVSEFTQKHPNENNMQEFMKRSYSVKDSICYYNPENDRIMVEGLEEMESLL
jgi:hypothetical protein